MKIVESLRIINNTIRNNLEKFRKFSIFKVNINEFMRIFDVCSTFLYDPKSVINKTIIKRVAS